MGKIIYPNLFAEMKKRRIKRKQIAEAIGINYNSFYNQLTGGAPLLWREAQKIRNTFFPDMYYDYLFARKE